MSKDIEQQRPGQPGPVRTASGSTAAPREQAIDWRVTVRHTTLRAEHRRRLVKARSREDAWREYLRELEPLLTAENYRAGERSPESAQRLREALQWLAAAKRSAIPDDTEILPEDYCRRRMDAIRVKGTLKREDVPEFPELASV